MKNLGMSVAQALGSVTGRHLAVASVGTGAVAFLLDVYGHDRISNAAVVTAVVLATLSMVLTAAWNGLQLIAATLDLVRARRGRHVVVRPHGSLFLGIVSIVFSTKTVERVFQPTVTDTRYEVNDALAKGSPKVKIFFIRLRGYYALAMALLPQAVLSLLKTALGKLVGIR